MIDEYHIIDLHMHSTASDGTDSPEEILEYVKEAGIEVFSVTDHDTVKAGAILRGQLKETDPRFIPGVEFSCKDGKGGKYHILGYGFDPEKGAVWDLANISHQYRMRKVRARLAFLETEFGFTFPEEDISQLMSLDNPGKPHIGNLMVKHGFAETKERAIKEYINRLRYPGEYIRPEEAIQAILAGGGVPVLAHPAYGNGDQLILGSELDERIRQMMDFGLQGLEAFYSGFTVKIRNEVLSLAEKYGLYVTAGSDYHGKNKLVMLGDTGCDDASAGPEGLLRFLEKVL